MPNFPFLNRGWQNAAKKVSPYAKAQAAKDKAVEAKVRPLQVQRVKRVAKKGK